MITGRVILYINILFFSLCGLAQTFTRDIQFVEHLFSIEEYREASIIINSYRESYKAEVHQNTLNYFQGKAHYYLKETQLSVEYFQKVNNQSGYFRESTYLKLYQQSYNGAFIQSRDGWNNTQFESELDKSIKYFEMAGNDLLIRDVEAYQKHMDLVDRNLAEIKTSASNLDKFYEGIKSFKKKSPFVAGILSTVIPGSGKMYIGKLGEGLMALVSTGIFGVQTWEAYRKDGVQSVRFILFASAFSTIYVANIWGSVLAVKIRRDEFNDQINGSVLLTMHVPLRRLFD